MRFYQLLKQSTHPKGCGRRLIPQNRLNLGPNTASKDQRDNQLESVYVKIRMTFTNNDEGMLKSTGTEGVGSQ
jgi:hypothetical protein